MVNAFETPTVVVSERQAAIACLTSHGFPALPVAPLQDSFKYPLKAKNKIVYEKDGVTPKPKFTGKNPSYLDSNGSPQTVDHKVYQDRLPTDDELQTWFANPLNGVGTLGGWNNTYWLDPDLKDFDYNQEALDSWFYGVLNQHESLQSSWWERTHSGGFRLAIKLDVEPGYTNFALEAGGKQRGQVLGAGRFAVLAPTVGISGKPYVNCNRAEPVKINSLEDLGIYSVTKPKTAEPFKRDRPELTLAVDNTKALRLEDLGSEKSKLVLKGEDIKDDESDSLTTAAKEWYGWENFCLGKGLPLKDTADGLTYLAGEKLGYDDSKIRRVIESIKIDNCTPASFQSGEKDCWLKIRSLNRTLYDQYCPTDIKPLVEKSLETFKRELEAKKQAEWTDRPVESYHIGSELAKAGFTLHEYDWVLLTQVNADLSIYAVCVEHRLSTEKPPMPMVKACAFGRLDKLFQAIPSILDLAYCNGYWWLEYLESKRKQAYDKLALHRSFGDRLRFNRLLLQPEIDGEAVDLECVKSLMETHHRLSLQGNQNEIIATVVSLAKEQSFSPVVEYLESCRASIKQYLTEQAILDNAFKLEPDSSLPSPQWEAVKKMYGNT